MNNSVKISRTHTVRIQNKNILWMCGSSNDRLYVSFCWNIMDENTMSNNYYYYQSYPDVKMEKVTILHKMSDCVMSNWIDMTELIFSDVKSIKVCNTSSCEIYSPALTLFDLRVKLIESNVTVSNSKLTNICTICHINNSQVITTFDNKSRNICYSCLNNTLGKKFITDNLFITLKL